MNNTITIYAQDKFRLNNVINKAESLLNFINHVLFYDGEKVPPLILMNDAYFFSK